MYLTQQNFDNLSAIFKKLTSLVLIFSFSAIYIKIIPYYIFIMFFIITLHTFTITL